MLEKVKELARVKMTDSPIQTINLINEYSNIKHWLDAAGPAGIEMDWVAEIFSIYGSFEIKSKQSLFSNSNWRVTWLVIGDALSNPIFLNTEDNAIYYAMHGQGNWRELYLAKNIDILNAQLEIWCDLFYGKFNKTILNDDFEISKEFNFELQEVLLAKLNSKDAKSFFDFVNL